MLKGHFVIVTFTVDVHTERQFSNYRFWTICSMSVVLHFAHKYYEAKPTFHWNMFNKTWGMMLLITKCPFNEYLCSNVWLRTVTGVFSTEGRFLLATWSRVSSNPRSRKWRAVRHEVNQVGTLLLRLTKRMKSQCRSYLDLWFFHEVLLSTPWARQNKETAEQEAIQIIS